MDEQDQSQSEELEAGGATVLPASEAMSLITQETSGLGDMGPDGPSEEFSDQDSSTDT